MKSNPVGTFLGRWNNDIITANCPITDQNHREGHQPTTCNHRGTEHAGHFEGGFWIVCLYIVWNINSPYLEWASTRWLLKQGHPRCHAVIFTSILDRYSLPNSMQTPFPMTCLELWNGHFFNRCTTSEYIMFLLCEVCRVYQLKGWLVCLQVEGLVAFRFT